MIKKVAIAQGFRLCFSDELGGMPYTADEINSDIQIVNVPVETKTIEPTDLCGEPATTIGWRSLGQIHSAVFTNIMNIPVSKIYYKFGDLDTAAEICQRLIARDYEPKAVTKVLTWEEVAEIYARKFEDFVDIE